MEAEIEGATPPDTGDNNTPPDAEANTETESPSPSSPCSSRPEPPLHPPSTLSTVEVNKLVQGLLDEPQLRERLEELRKRGIISAVVFMVPLLMNPDDWTALFDHLCFVQSPLDAHCYLSLAGTAVVHDQ